MKQHTNDTTNPRWWGEQHTSAWDRMKEALRRDWEQTKADTLKHGGKDLNQNVGDTVKQAVGAEAIPPGNQPNPGGRDEWTRAEQPLRYGHGARTQYSAEHADWDDRVENKLKTEWTDLKTGRTWDEVKGHVRHGWDSARRK